MRVLLMLMIEHGLANYGFRYVTAPQPIRQNTDDKQEIDQFAKLPQLIEMPHLGGGSQNLFNSSHRNDVQVRQVAVEQVEPCPPCPAPAPPTDCSIQCHELKCPELICDVVKADAENEDNSVDHDKLLNEEERLRARFARRQKRQITVSSIVQLSNKCNDQFLRTIMLDSISSNIVVAKVTIAERASHEIGGQFDVICTTGVFSYYVAARLFCEVTRGGTTCFAFRHDDLGSDMARSPFAGLERPLHKEDDAEFSDKIAESDVEQVQNPSLAAILDAEDAESLLGINRWMRTTTPSSEKSKEFDGNDAQTQNLREETFNELIAELEKRQRLQH